MHINKVPADQKWFSMCLSSKNFQIRLNARNILKCLQKIKNSFVGVTLQSINTTGTGLTSHGQDLPFSSRRQHEILYNKGNKQGQRISSYISVQISTCIYTVQINMQVHSLGPLNIYIQILTSISQTNLHICTTISSTLILTVNYRGKMILVCKFLFVCTW